MLRKILLVLAALVAGLLVIVALQPAEFHVERTATLAAPPERVFAQVNEFAKWRAWSPWEKMDPTMQRTYEGAPAGPGASYTWAGNRNIGSGRMTIMESRPPEMIGIKLEFYEPMSSVNFTEFRFKPEGSQTVVTWSMSGPNNFIGKAISLFMNMDKMIGGQFEQGLADLEAASSGERE